MYDEIIVIAIVRKIGKEGKNKHESLIIDETGEFFFQIEKCKYQKVFESKF